MSYKRRQSENPIVLQTDRWTHQPLSSSLWARGKIGFLNVKKEVKSRHTYFSFNKLPKRAILSMFRKGWRGPQWRLILVKIWIMPRKKLQIGRFTSWGNWTSNITNNVQISVNMLPYLIFVIFYTNIFWGLKILHWKVRKFTTKGASWQNSVKLRTVFIIIHFV